MNSIDFSIVGAQKSGTTALSFFLNQHPDIVMSHPKEAHVFDSKSYNQQKTKNEIDKQYQAYFPTVLTKCLRGEATPIYMFYPEIPIALKKYNDDLKLIVILRDPTERALSHYQMEIERNTECLPFWLALLVEKWRLHFDANRRAPDSSFRLHSYRERGLYSIQLENIYKSFSPSQVLIVWSKSLEKNHAETLANVFEFLGVSRFDGIAAERIFEGQYPKNPKGHAITKKVLKLSYLLEYFRLNRLLKRYEVD